MRSSLVRVLRTRLRQEKKNKRDISIIIFLFSTFSNSFDH